MNTDRALRDLGGDEQVLLVARRHWLVLLRAWLPPLVAAACGGASATALSALGLSAAAWVIGVLLLLVPPWCLWAWADWRADVLVLTHERVLWIERTPLLRERRWEAPLAAMKNVGSISGGPVGRVFGCSDLVLDTASRGVQLLRGMRDATNVAARIIDAQQYAARRSTRLSRLRHEMGLPRQPAPVDRRGVGSDAPTDAPALWRRHPWLLIRSCARPAFMAIAGVGLSAGLDAPPILVAATCIALLWTGWLWEDWRNDELVATADRVIRTSRSPLGLHEESWRASLDKVQDVSYSLPSPLAKALDYGTLTITTAGDGQALSLEGVPHPREVSAELNRRLRLVRTSSDRALMEEVERTVQQVLRDHGIERGR